MLMGTTNKAKTKDGEIEELKSQLSALTSASNSWSSLVDFFETNEIIKPYYQEVIEECRKDNYFGMSTVMIMTIEKLLEKVTDLEENIELRDNVIKLELPPVKSVTVVGKIVKVIDNQNKNIE